MKLCGECNPANYVDKVNFMAGRTVVPTDGKAPVAPSSPQSVKMTVTLPREVAAFLRWKAEVEGLKRDELLRKIIVHYAKRLRKEDFRTPPIED